MTRGSLINLIHWRALKVQASLYEDGSSTSLMSTDVDHLQPVFEMLHETWAYLLETVIGTSLLSGQIGWICLVPLLLIFR